MKTLQNNCGKSPAEVSRWQSEKLVCSICEQPIEDNDYITFIESGLVVCARCAFEGIEFASGEEMEEKSGITETNNH